MLYHHSTGNLLDAAKWISAHVIARGRFAVILGKADIVESAAISASALCLAHCLALPFLLLLLPGLLGLYAASEAAHLVALALVVPFALVAFALGYRHHGALRPAVIGTIGLGCLVMAVLPLWGEGWETPLTVAGSGLLIFAHAVNWRLRSAAKRH